MVESDLKVVLAAIEKKDQEAIKRHEEIKCKLSELTKSQAAVVKRVENCETKSKSVDIEMIKLKGEVNSLRQAQLSKKVLIRGVPLLKNETLQTLRAVVDELFLLLKIESKCILAVKRFGKVMDQQERLILVTVDSDETKYLLIKHKREKQIYIKDLMANFATHTSADRVVFVDEYLTPFNNYLLKSAKKLKTERNMKYVWIKNGVIHLKQSDTSEVILIRNQLDLDSCSVKFKKRHREGSDNDERDLETIGQRKKQGKLDRGKEKGAAKGSQPT